MSAITFPVPNMTVSLRDTESISIKTSENEFGRLLDGTPVRSAKATPEMISVATTVVEKLCEHGFMSGWFGDKGSEFQADQVNVMIERFIKFVETGTPCQREIVGSNVYNLHFYAEIDQEIIKGYARFLGYQYDPQAFNFAAGPLSMLRPLQA